MYCEYTLIILSLFFSRVMQVFTPLTKRGYLPCNNRNFMSSGVATEKRSFFFPSAIVSEK